MNEREIFNAEEKKKRIYFNSMGQCEICRRPISLHTSQIAHKIGQTKRNLKKYGKGVIHDEANLALVCSLKCNSKVDISFNPGEVQKVLEKIVEERR